MPIVSFQPSDPNTTTRENFTANITSVPIPEDAAPDWASAVRHQQGLYRALYEHSAMEPNRQQTFMTPANRKSRVYHLWDFVGRTLQFFYMVDYQTPAKDRKGQDKEIFEDAIGRRYMSQFLVEDTSGKMNFMLNVNIDVDVDFGDEVKRAAAA